jgi:ABC-type multidrug transport system ATPase subunit
MGLIEPSGGSAMIGGYDITKEMDDIYSLMGVCPQHDLLWGTLTGGPGCAAVRLFCVVFDPY